MGVRDDEPQLARLQGTPLESCDIAGHPGEKSNTVKTEDKKWVDEGSGTFTRLFEDAEHFVTTTKHGPTMSDIHTRITRSLTTGTIIDDAIVQDTSDRLLNRRPPTRDNIQV